jgi:hypothetical protein
LNVLFTSQKSSVCKDSRSDIAGWTAVNRRERFTPIRWGKDTPASSEEARTPGKKLTDLFVERAKPAA